MRLTCLYWRRRLGNARHHHAFVTHRGKPPAPPGGSGASTGCTRNRRILGRPIAILMQPHVPSRSGAICRYADGLVRAKIDAYGCDAMSMPAIVTAALANDLKPFIEAHRRLIARWSRSMMLFRYFELRTLTRRQAGCSRRKTRNARWLGAWPSSVALRGARSGCEASAFRKNACAAAMPDPLAA